MPASVSCQGLITTLRLVHCGATVWPAEVRRPLSAQEEGPVGSPLLLTGEILLPDRIPPDNLDHPRKLSERQIRVLTGLREGYANKEIARSLGISEATVKIHVKAILRKAGVRNRTQAALWAS